MRTWILGALALAVGCGGDSPLVEISPEGQRGSDVVLGCPVFRSTTLTQTVVGSGAITGGTETDLVTSSFDGTDAFLRIYAGSADGAFVLSTECTVAGISALPFVAVADADADGRADLVVCDPGSGGTAGRILLLSQKADGTFTESTLVAPAWPVDAAVADYDGDSTSEVYILDGSTLHRIEAGAVDALSLSASYRFLAAGVFSTGGRVLAAATAGGTVHLLDVAVSSVSVWLTIPLADPTIAGLHAAEFNGDAAADLAVAVEISGGHLVRVLRNDGAAFTAVAACGLGGALHDFVVGDVSGDGLADLLISEAKDGWDYVGVAYSGSLGSTTRLIEGYWPSMIAGQFNGVGAQDVVFSDRYFFEGGQNPDAVHSYSLGDGPSAVAVGDFNNDGRPDLAAFLNSSGELSVALGTGPMTFGAPAASTIDLWNAVQALAGRMDADANVDLVVRDGSDVYLLFGNGTGGFTNPVWIGSGAGMALVDTNADGALEVAFTDPYQNRVRLYRATDGSHADIAVAGWPSGIAAGDFDGDGRADLAVASMNENRVRLLLQDGLGGFLAGAVVDLPGQPWAVATGDFDGDGYRDLVVSASTSGFWMARGGASATLGAPLTFTAGFVDSLAAGDLDGDGRSELISLDSDGSMVNVYVGALGAPLTTSKVYPAAWYSSSLTLADADGDGAPDVTVGNNAMSGTGDPILIWRNISGGLQP